jgi:tellurite resistance protein
VTEREFIQQLAESEVQALVEVMFLAAQADGEVGDNEIAELAQTTERVTNGHVPRVQAERLLQRARDEFNKSDRETRLEAVKAALAPERRKHALLLAIQVTYSDGVIRTSERDLILQTAEALEIDGDTAADLVKIVER